MTVTDLTKHPKYLARRYSRTGRWGYFDERSLLRLSLGGAPMDELVEDLHRSPKQIRAKLRSLTLNGQLTAAEAAQRFHDRYGGRDALVCRPFRIRRVT